VRLGPRDSGAVGGLVEKVVSHETTDQVGVLERREQSRDPSRLHHVVGVAKKQTIAAGCQDAGVASRRDSGGVAGVDDGERQAIGPGFGDFARAVGLPVTRLTFETLAMSGAIAGLVGAIAVFGIHHRYIDGMLVQPLYAWTGIIAVLLVGMIPWLVMAEHLGRTGK